MCDEGSIRVLVVDDHIVVRNGIAAVFDVEPDIQLVGEAEDGFQAVEYARTLCPDVILMDLLMPRMDGITAIEKILDQQPDLPILVLTSFVEEDRIILAIKRGAMGYLMKDTSSEQLVNAIKKVYHKQPLLPEPVIRLLKGDGVNVFDRLTPLEIRLLEMIAQGYTDETIAADLSITPNMVHANMRTLMNKLQLQSRVQAALFANYYGIGRE